MTITRGTTPTVTCILPDEIPTGQIAELWFSIDQAGDTKCRPARSAVKIDRIFSKGEVEMTGNLLAITLSQEETLSLTPKVRAQLGVRILFDSGRAIAAEEGFGSMVNVVNPGPKGGVIQ